MKLLLVLLVCLFSHGFGAIYDCFLFLNEWEVLEIRLHEMDRFVDKFVLVEARETFKGQPKPLLFDQLKERFSKFSHKFIHIVIDQPFETSNPWEREFFQRNQIMRALHDCRDEDLILISDVDEIMDPRVLPSVIQKVHDDHPIVCEQQIYRHFLNREDTKLKHQWIGTVATTFRLLKDKSPQWMRDHRSRFEVIPSAGWHFTAMGGYDRYVEKIISFSHDQNEFPIPTKEEFSSMVKRYQLVPMDDTFPSYVLENLDHLKTLSMIDTP